MADPGVVPDLGEAAFAMGEEVRVMFRVGPVVGGAVHEMMQAGAVERVVGGADPGEGRDVGELADARVGQVAEPRGVGIIAERGVQQDAARPDLGIAAEGGIGDARALVDERLFAEFFVMMVPRVRGEKQRDVTLM
jgi:hypothetical protein